MCSAASDDLTQDKWLGAMQWCSSFGAAATWCAKKTLFLK